MADRTCCGNENVRAPYAPDEPFNPTLGLTPLGDSIYQCTKCGRRYRRTVESATMFHDYETYVFTEIDPVP